LKKKIVGIFIVTLLVTTTYTILAEVENNITPEIVIKNTIPDDPYFSLQWHLDNTGQSNPHSGEGSNDCDIDAPEAWDIQIGDSDIVIAVIDCGIDYTHPDLAANIWVNEDEIPGNGIDDDNNGYIDDIRGWNFYDDNNDLLDLGGHGTAHAGVAGAVGNNGIGITGVAWNCEIMPIHCVDEFDNGKISDIADGIRYAADNGANVISMSFGRYTNSNTMASAVEYAYDKGVVLVAAAGNDGTDEKWYPAGYDQVIAVGGTDNNDHKMDCFRYGLHGVSNYGDWVDVSAASVDVYLTMPTYPVTFNSLLGLNQDYDYMSGTSFSCPQVSGLAALLLSQDPSLTNEEVRKIIRANVDPYTSNEYIGTGRINAHKALTRFNTQPDKPTIIGPSSGKPGKPYSFTASTTDPNGDQISYLWDWGDGNFSEWLDTPEATYTWEQEAKFNISVRAKDIYGAESDWSEPLSFSAPKNKPYINTPFLNFLENHLHMFPLLRQLLGL